MLPDSDERSQTCETPRRKISQHKPQTKTKFTLGSFFRSAEIIVFSNALAGALGEIRTPDPQIRSLMGAAAFRDRCLEPANRAQHRGLDRNSAGSSAVLDRNENKRKSEQACAIFAHASGQPAQIPRFSVQSISEAIVAKRSSIRVASLWKTYLKPKQPDTGPNSVSLYTTSFRDW
jgi:hypothetical protein